MAYDKTARDDADLFADVAREDGQRAYGGHDREVDPTSLDDGFSASDQRPSRPFDSGELSYLPGQEFARRDGSRSR
jgi:hypothetical protein